MFLDQIKEVIEKGNLAKHISRIERLVDQDFTSLEIAAALLKMSMKEVKTKEKSVEASKGLEGPKPGMDRLFITLGKKDRVHPKDFIDALTDNTSIPAGKIGDIDLYDKFSFVEVSQEYTQEILDRMGRTNIIGKSVSIEKAQRKGAEGEGKSEGGSRKGGGGGGFRSRNDDGGSRGFRKDDGGGFRKRSSDGGGFRKKDSKRW